MSTTTITIVVEFDDATDYPSGSATIVDGAQQDFHGWLGLASVIEALARSSAITTTTTLSREGESA